MFHLKGTPHVSNTGLMYARSLLIVENGRGELCAPESLMDPRKEDLLKLLNLSQHFPGPSWREEPLLAALSAAGMCSDITIQVQQMLIPSALHLYQQVCTGVEKNNMFVCLSGTAWKSESDQVPLV
jgi:hypothetical protein